MTIFELMMKICGSLDVLGRCLLPYRRERTVACIEIPRSVVVVRERLKLRVRERRWFVLERPRRDTNGGSETEVTVTSKLPE